MSISVPKHTLCSLYCCFRQAERSVHYVASNIAYWSQFQDYYKGERTQLAADLSAYLIRQGARDSSVGVRQLLDNDWISEVLLQLIRLVGNQFKHTWSLSKLELSVMYSALRDFMQLTHQPTAARCEELVVLRMQLYGCQVLIEKKMIGTSDLSKFERVEHFFSSPYIRHYTLRELGVHPGVC